MHLEMGLIAKKVGMTQLFTEDGTRVAVTVLQAKDNVVTAHRTEERDGYIALQLGFDEQKPSRLNKPALGQFKAANVAPRRKVREFRVTAKELEAHAVGSDVTVGIFSEGQMVDVTGTSKGKGFQGVMKRHNMRGEKRTHGNHETFRHGGSIGCRLTPGRVLKGKRMAGQMGSETVTLQNVKVVKVIADEGLILVKGPVPGANNGYLKVRHAVKPAAKARANAAKGK